MLLAVLALLVSMTPVVSAAKPVPPPAGRQADTEKAIFFASDGMRPDLVDGTSPRASMPTYGADGEGRQGRQRNDAGLPAEHRRRLVHAGDGNVAGRARLDEQHLSTAPARATSTTARASRRPATLQADTIAAAAERAGKKVAQIDWVGGAHAGIAGPTVDFRNFFSTRGVLAAPLNATEQAGAAAFGVSYQVAAFAPASGWTNVPAGDPAAPPQQTTLTVATTFAAQNPNRTYDVYVYDSVVNGARGLRPRRRSCRRRRQGRRARRRSNLAVGDFEEIKLTGADGLIGAACRPDRRLLHQADHARGAGPSARSSCTSPRSSA